MVGVKSGKTQLSQNVQQRKTTKKQRQSTTNRQQQFQSFCRFSCGLAAIVFFSMDQMITPIYMHRRTLFRWQRAGSCFYRLLSLQLHRPLSQSQDRAPIITIGIPLCFSLGELRHRKMELLGFLNFIRKQKYCFQRGKHQRDKERRSHRSKL